MKHIKAHTVRLDMFFVANMKTDLASHLLFWIAGKNPDHAGFIESYYIVGVSFKAFNIHAWRSRWHPGYTNTDDIWSFTEQTFYFSNRHMTFNYIAINDGCMASLEFWRNMVTGFNTCKIFFFFNIYREAIVFQIQSPAYAATSSG